MKSLIFSTQKLIEEDTTASCSTWCAGQDMKGLMKKLLGCWLLSLIMLQNSSPTFMSDIWISLDLTLDHKNHQEYNQFLLLFTGGQRRNLCLTTFCTQLAFLPLLLLFILLWATSAATQLHIYPGFHRFPLLIHETHHFLHLHIWDSLQTLWQILSIYLLRLEVDQIFED